jgi:hypothetical protein
MKRRLHGLLERARPRRALSGIASVARRAVEYLTLSPAGLVYYRLRGGPLGDYLWLSRRIPGWTRGAEARALAETSHSLPDGATIVEIGSFLGSSTVLLAGGRKLRRSGTVHAIDPFDASGDAFSVPIYRSILASVPGTLQQRFNDNIRRTGLVEWVEVHQGRAADVAATWTAPVDLLFLDGDQSYAGVRTAYHAWHRFLKPGAVIAVHNSRPGRYHEQHDGHRRLVQESIRAPQYGDIRCIGTTTFARKMHAHNR